MQFQDRYSKLDRLLHRWAFSAIEIQKALADIEARLYARHLDGIEIDRPLFITALPRAGTTLLLETLGSLEVFATHTYRNMPFLLIPLLWNALSRRFRAPDAVVERAHGDGMTIGFDSPEAFEEVVWRAFWPEKYLDDRIATWTATDEDVHREFGPFIKSHLAKMIALRAETKPEAVRYLSKNNANISRIAKIVQLFPDALILVPFRNPLDHVASLLRQHLNFLKIHAAEPFTRRYMADIGHFDLGANLRPVDFGHWLSREYSQLTHTADFWLNYWRTAYAHILANSHHNLLLVNYDSLCANPGPTLRRIGDAIGIDNPTDLVALGGRFRPPTRYDADALNIDQSLLGTASELHRELQNRSI